jgi:hypothetical protein
MTRVRTRAKGWYFLAPLSALGILLASLGVAEPILHEYFDFDEVVDGSGSEQTAAGLSAGDSPQTGNGNGANPNAANANGQNAPNGAPADAQRGNSENDDSYQLDSNTTRPDQVGYEDPFTPSIPPFKRLYAYDSVDTRFELVVANASLAPLALQGQLLGAELDQFFGDIELSATAGVPERFPSVGPGAVIFAAKLDPPSPFELQRDGADNWFITRPDSGPAHLRVHLGIDRAAFGSPYRDPEWRDLARFVVALPPNVKRRGVDVADQLGVSRADRPNVAVTKLIAHFRSFAPDETRSEAKDPGALYREIALARKGVCRHRAYAFTVTALALGIPTRFVRNEAHAWVEIHDATSWHRVDLGGAAGEMQLTTNVDVAHVPPADPFEWPKGSESAEDMTDAAMRTEGNGGDSRSTSPTGESPTPTGSSNADAPPTGSAAPNGSVSPNGASTAFTQGAPSSGFVPATPTSGLSPAPSPSLGQGTLGQHENLDGPDIELGQHEDMVMQGGRVHLAGRVTRGTAPCALVRVDVVLRAGERTIPVGSLVTDRDGAYSGAITLPYSVPVGDYDLSAVPEKVSGCGVE